MGEIVLGVDPGAVDGAAVLVMHGDPETPPVGAINAWRWHRLGGKGSTLYEVVDAWGVRVEVRTLGEVGRRIMVQSHVHVPRWHLCVEGLFVVNDPKRFPSALTLAEATGQVMGPLCQYAIGEVMRPTAAVWRAKVLKLPRSTSAKAAEAYAVKALPGIVLGLGDLSGCGHTAEAGIIAYYGAVTVRRAGL